MKKIITIIGVLCCLFVSNAFAQANNQSVQRTLQELRQIQGSTPNNQTSNQPQLQLRQNQANQNNPALNQSSQPSQQNQANQNNQTGNQTSLQSQPNQNQASTAATPNQHYVAGQNEALNEAAFRQMSQNALPMSPQQIVRLRKLYDETQFASAATAGTPPKPTATSQFVNLSPGATPPVIRLSEGFITSLVFLDSTGAPWPIAAYDNGNPGAFNIQWDKKSNTLMIQAVKLYTYGNLAIRLKGLDTPVMITLIPGQKAVDYRVDLRVQGLGPNAKHSPFGQGMPNGANPLLLSVLDGVAPPGSRALTVTGGTAQAWSSGDKLFIRTRFTILSPSWMATMSSADGTHVYEMQKTPLLLVSSHGRVMQVRIEGY